MEGTSWNRQVSDMGKEDREFHFAIHFLASFVNKITKSILKVLDLILNSMWPCGTWISDK